MCLSFWPTPGFHPRHCAGAEFGLHVGRRRGKEPVRTFPSRPRKGRGFPSTSTSTFLSLDTGVVRGLGNGLWLIKLNAMNCKRGNRRSGGHEFAKLPKLSGSTLFQGPQYKGSPKLHLPTDLGNSLANVFFGQLLDIAYAWSVSVKERHTNGYLLSVSSPRTLSPSHEHKLAFISYMQLLNKHCSLLFHVYSNVHFIQRGSYHSFVQSRPFDLLVSPFWSIVMAPKGDHLLVPGP